MCLSAVSNSVILRLESHPRIDYIKCQSKGLNVNNVMTTIQFHNAILHTFESLKPSKLKRAFCSHDRAKVEEKYFTGSLF